MQAQFAQRGVGEQQLCPQPHPVHRLDPPWRIDRAMGAQPLDAPKIGFGLGAGLLVLLRPRVFLQEFQHEARPDIPDKLGHVVGFEIEMGVAIQDAARVNPGIGRNRRRLFSALSQHHLALHQNVTFGVGCPATSLRARYTLPAFSDGLR